MGQKQDYGDGGKFDGLFITTRVKHCLTFNEGGVIEGKK